MSITVVLRTGETFPIANADEVSANPYDSKGKVKTFVRQMPDGSQGVVAWFVTANMAGWYRAPKDPDGAMQILVRMLNERSFEISAASVSIEDERDATYAVFRAGAKQDDIVAVLNLAYVAGWHPTDPRRHLGFPTSSEDRVR